MIKYSMSHAVFYRMLNSPNFGELSTFLTQSIFYGNCFGWPMVDDFFYSVHIRRLLDGEVT